MKNLYELNNELLHNCIEEIEEKELEEILCEDNLYIRTMTNICPTSFLTCC